MICTYRFICAWIKYTPARKWMKWNCIKAFCDYETDKMINHYVKHVVVGFTHKIWDTLTHSHKQREREIWSRSNQGWFRAWKICFNREREKHNPPTHTHVHDYKPVNWMNNNQCECHVQQSVSLFQNGRNVELFVEEVCVCICVCNKFKSVRLRSKRMTKQCTTHRNIQWNTIEFNVTTWHSVNELYLVLPE